MKSKITFIITILLFQSGMAQKLNETKNELEIRFQPDSVVYVYDNIGPEMPKQLLTAVIQNMAFVNSTDKPILLKQATLEVKKDGNVIQSKRILSNKMKASAAKFKMLEKYGALELYDFQFQTSKYLKGFAMAASDTLNPGSALIIPHETFLFDALPDELVVSVSSSGLDKVENTVSKTLKVIDFKSENKYILPLKGSWTTAAGPSLIGHHRWGSIQEFAYDFIKIGDKQKSHRASGSKLEDYYAYGEPVFSIADGVVVAAMDGIQESSDNLKRSDESEEDYMKRMRPYQEELMSKGLKYVFGNHVIIKHPNNEYSSYFHFKNGSVAVSVGDTVKQGQLIGQIGHSGNSTEPHLHFHVSNGPDVAYSRSLPVEFDNIVLFPVDNGKIRHIHSGQILKTKD